MFVNQNFRLLMLVIASVLLAPLLTGCFQTAPKIVYKTTILVLESPSTLTDKTTIPAPPKRETYVSASIQEREKLLTDYSRSLISAVQMCNRDKDAIITWTKDQKALAEKKNQAEK